MTVWTRDPKLEKQLARTCDPSLDYRVEVLPPLPDSLSTRAGAHYPVGHARTGRRPRAC